MAINCNIKVNPEDINDEVIIRSLAAKAAGVDVGSIRHVELLRRSVDARKAPAHFVLRLNLWIDEDYEPNPKDNEDWPDVSQATEVLVAGMGPAGLFAALELIRLGIKPVLIDRGKSVRDRRRDLAKLTREGEVNPDSNYCFGEGGAGTFSDGKLYTRSTKRGVIEDVLQLLVKFGASQDILIDAHPHIGTNKLPQIIQNIREHIIACGGEIHFNTRLTDLEINGNELKRVEINGREKWSAKSLVLATGHSARDIFTMLAKYQGLIEAKPFALGVRVEHPQHLIDQIQYHMKSGRHENLPAASYTLVRQVMGKGVYSFCMCPGGIICPAATAPEEIVVNGWSPSRRNNPYANSGIVVELQLNDFNGEDALSGLRFQQAVERSAWVAGGGKQVAPGQRLTDFVNDRTSKDLPDCSYIPGLNSVDMREVLPGFIAERLREGFRYFGKRLKGYLSREAVIVGVESRTSSPVRIPRNQEDLMHPNLRGLFPSGEGAGYAGGIMSAALDGQKVARAVKAYLNG